MKKLYYLLLILVLCLPAGVSAQQGVHFSELMIEIWPEYDQPEVLVIYRGFLSPEVSLPAEISFQIPAEAGQPNAVAVRDPNQQLISVQYQRVLRGDWAEITFTATSQEIQFEFYDPALSTAGEQREYTYRWPGNHQVDQGLIQVQQPRSSQNIEITPALGNSFVGSDGLTYYYRQYQPLPQEPLTIELAYTKSSQVLSVGEEPVQPSVPIEVKPSLSFQGRSLLPWILGGLGLLLLLGAVLLYRGLGTEAQFPLRFGDLLFSGSEKSPARGYCPSCGTPRGERDRFCRKCGHKF